jgi:flagellar protein FliS
MAASAYARRYQSQSILTANPGQLVLMLYDGALRFISLAQAGFEMPVDSPQRFETINSGILRAQAVIQELQANLNLDEGGELAENLDRLYSYHLDRLFFSNIRKNETALAEVERLVRELRDGWAEMLQQNQVSVA